MRSIFVGVEPTVRMITGALTDELLIVPHLLFENWLRNEGQVAHP
jgi:hypothetical protein